MTIRAENIGRGAAARSALLFLLVVAPLHTPAGARPSVLDLLRTGDQKRSQFDFHGALQDYSEAHSLDGHNAEVLWRISRVHAELAEESNTKTDQKNLYIKSQNYASRAVATDPKNASAHVALAIAHGEIAMRESGKKKVELSRMVKEEAEKAIDLNPGSDIAYHILGRWHREVANLSPLLRAMARLVYGRLPDASMAEALRNLAKASSLAPRVISHHKELGKTHLLLGNKELARKEFLLVLALPNELKTDERSKNEVRRLLDELRDR